MIFGGVFFLENEQNIWCAAFGALLCKWNKLIMLLNNFRVTLQTEESCFILFNFSWFLHFAAYIFIILCCFRHNYIIYHSAKGGVVHLLVCNCLLLLYAWVGKFIFQLCMPSELWPTSHPPPPPPPPTPFGALEWHLVNWHGDSFHCRANIDKVLVSSKQIEINKWRNTFYAGTFAHINTLSTHIFIEFIKQLIKIIFN